MTPTAAYDELADWYETEFMGRPSDQTAPTDALGTRAALTELLGVGQGTCLEIGCGTGRYAETIRSLGRTPVGVDLSAGMLRWAQDRLPVALGDAQRLPIATASVRAAATVMVHTDVADYPAVLREVARVLEPGGVFVHVGLHPCFCGSFADRGHAAGVVISPGYLDAGALTKKSWSDEGIRSKIGSYHLPMSSLLNVFSAAGLNIEQVSESGGPTPAILAIRARLGC